MSIKLAFGALVAFGFVFVLMFTYASAMRYFKPVDKKNAHRNKV